MVEPENNCISLDVKLDYVAVLKYISLADPLPSILS
jgi:hypothetical protein